MGSMSGNTLSSLLSNSNVNVGGTLALNDSVSWTGNTVLSNGSDLYFGSAGTSPSTSNVYVVAIANQSASYAYTPSVSWGLFTDAAGTTPFTAATATGSPSWSTFGKASMGTGSNAGTYNLSYAGGLTLSGGYSLVAGNGTDYKINPLAVTAVGSNGIGGITKAYDGTNKVSLSSGSVPSIILTGDSVALYQNGSFSNSNIGSNMTMNMNSVLAGPSAGNYAIASSSSSLTGTITPAILTVTGSIANNKIYDATTVASITGGVLTGIVGNDVVTLTQSGIFAMANVGNGIAVTVQDLISGAQASNYTLLQPAGLVANITPKALTVANTVAANKVYDTTTIASISGGTLVGIIGADVVNLNQVGTFATANVGTGIAVTTADTLSGSGAINYSLTQPSGLTANITGKALTVINSVASNKVYDGTAVTTIISGTLSGLAAADISYVGLTQAGTFASINVGNGIAVAANDVLTGTRAGNYTLTQPTGLLANITAKSLTVTGTIASNKVYDATTSATVGNGALVGILAGDTVTLAQAGNFAFANAGTGIAITTADTISGPQAGNYTLAQPTGVVANITAKSLSVINSVASNKIYDATTAGAITGGALVGVLGSDIVNLTQAGTFASAAVGTGIVVTAKDVLTGAQAANYSLIQPTGLTANITPKVLNVTVTNTVAASKVYDGTNIATLGSGVLVGVSAADAAFVSLTQAGTFAQSSVGNAIAVTANDALTGTKAANYTLVQPTGLTANITAKSLTVINSVVANKVYDATTTATITAGTLVGVVAGDTILLTQAGSFAMPNAGTAITVTANDSISGTNSGNYSLTQPTGLAANITPKSLTVTGTLSAANKVYDATATAIVNGGTLAGVISGDIIVLNQRGTFAKSTVGNGIAVTVNDVLSGINTSNYSLIQPIAALTANITPKALTVIGSTVSTKAYDSTTVATVIGGSLVGVMGSDIITLAQAGAFASANVGTGIAVTAKDTITGVQVSNYTLTQPGGLTGIITGKKLTVTGSVVANKVYDTSTAATVTGGVLVGVVGADVITLTQAGSFASANVGTGIAITIADSLGGANAANYSITQPIGAKANITPKALTVTGALTATNKVYNKTADAVIAGGTLVGVIGSDAVDLNQIGKFASNNVGTGIAVTIADTITGASASNYTLTQPIATLKANITPAPLTVTGTVAANKYYDATTASTITGGVLSGVITGDVVTLTQAGVFVSSNAGNGIAVTTSDTIAGAGAANYTLLQPAGISANIIAKIVTVTVANTVVANKVYDGTTNATLTKGTIVGIATPDIPYVTLTQSGVFTSANVGTGIAITVNDSLSGSKSANYLLTQPTGLTANITPKALTVGGVLVAASKIYNANASAIITGGTLAGVIAGDTVTLTQAGNFSSKNVGNNIPITIADTISGASAGNYTLTQPTIALNASIAPAQLRVTGSVGTSKIYDATTVATITGGVLAGVIAGDTVTLTQAGAFASANAGNGIIINAADTIAGASAANYTLVQPAGITANITAKIVTVTIANTVVANKVYDGTTKATLTGGTIVGVSAADAPFVTLTQAGVFASANVGTGIAVTANDSLAGTKSANYLITQPTGLTANITPKALTVSGILVAASKVYDANTNATITGGTLAGVIAGDTVALAQAGNFAGKNVGSNIPVTIADTISGASAGNYTLTQPATALTANINPTSLTITGQSAANKIYDATSVATLSGGALSGVLATDVVTLTQLGNFTNLNVGNAIAVTATNTIAGADAGNYTLKQPVGLTANITPRIITVTIANTVVANKVYDGTTKATLTGGTIVGVTAADALYVALTQSGVFASANAGTGIAVIVNDSLTGAKSANYLITQPTGLTANITPKVLTVGGVLTAANKVYDATNTAVINGGALAGVITGDDVSLAQAGTFSASNVAANLPITVADTISGTSAGNYLLTQPIAALKASITPKALIVTGSTASNKSYDGSTAATIAGGTLNGIVGLDVVTLNQSGSFVSPNVGNGIAVTATNTISGAQAANYTITQPTGLTANITAKILTITVTNTVASNKVYDGTNVASLINGTLVGLAPSDIGAVTLIQAGTFAQVNVGNAIAVTANDSLSGARASNYLLTQPTGLTANITPKPLTLSGITVAANKVYDGLTSVAVSGGVLSAGILPGDSVTLVQAGNLAVKSVGSNLAVTITDTLTGASAANYMVAQPTGVKTNVTPAPLSIAATNLNKVYGTAPSLLANFVATGLQNGETIGSVTEISAGLSATTPVSATSYSIVPSAATGGTFAASNYTITYVNGALTVTPAPLVITATSSTKVYGTESAATSAFTSVGLKNGESIGSVAIASTGYSASASVAGAPYTLAASAASGGSFIASNYAITYVNGTLTVTKAPLYINATSQTKVYGTAVDLSTAFTSTGLKNGETIGSVTASNIGSGAAGNVSATPYNTIISAATGGTFTPGNYAITYFNGTLTVNAAPLTITANSATAKAGATPTLLNTAFTTQGLMNGQSVGAVTEVVTGTAIVASKATGGSFNPNNYAITYVNGVLTMTP